MDAITYALAKKYTDNKIVESAALHRQIIQSLPSTGDETIIYMIPVTGSGDDNYNEYMWIDGAWELIGNTRVDLTDYYNKTQMDTALDGKANKSLLESGNDHFQFGVDGNGNYGYVKKIGGADTVIPFKTVGTRSGAITANGTYTASTDILKDGYESVTVSVSPNLQSKTVTAGTTNVTVSPDASYGGLSSVVVQPTPSQTKSVTPSTSAQTVSPDSGKLLSSVSVGAISTQTKSVTPSTSAQTVAPDSGKYLSSVSVGAIPNQHMTNSMIVPKWGTGSGSSVPAIRVATLNPRVDFNNSTTYGSAEMVEVAMPEGYYAWSYGNSSCCIPTETKTVTAGTSATSVTPSGYNTSGQYLKYLKSVTVNPTPSQEKTITASRSAQTVTPDSGKLLSKVTVNKYPDASGTYTVSGHGTALDMGATNNYRYVNTSKAWNAGVNDAESKVASIIDTATTAYERIGCQPESTVAQMQSWYRPYGVDCVGKCGYGIYNSRLYNEVLEVRRNTSVVK